MVFQADYDKIEDVIAIITPKNITKLTSQKFSIVNYNILLFAQCNQPELSTSFIVRSCLRGLLEQQLKIE